MWNAIILVQDLNSCRLSISYDDNHYTTGTSYDIYIYIYTHLKFVFMQSMFQQPYFPHTRIHFKGLVFLLHFFFVRVLLLRCFIVSIGLYGLRYLVSQCLRCFGGFFGWTVFMWFCPWIEMMSCLISSMVLFRHKVEHDLFLIEGNVQYFLG